MDGESAEQTRGGMRGGDGLHGEVTVTDAVR